MNNSLPQQKYPSISIVILTFNSEPYIKACLNAVQGLDYPDFEVIVVDNNSVDKTLEIVRQFDVRIIENKMNRGFAGGNNDGWRCSTGEIVLLLNPDTIITRKFLKALVKSFIDDPEVAVAGGKIYYPGSQVLQHCGGVLYPNAMSDHIGKGEIDSGKYDVPRTVDYVTGAAMAVRRAILLAYGGLDEDYYPAYFEETDLCFKVRRDGKKVLYIPEAIIYHHESVSLKHLSPKFYKMYYRSRMIFVRKHYSFSYVISTFIPFEFKWFFSSWAKGVRLKIITSYFQGIKFWFTIKPEKTDKQLLSGKDEAV